MTDVKKPVVDTSIPAPYKEAPWVPKQGTKEVGSPFAASRAGESEMIATEKAAREAKEKYARENPNKKLGEPG